MRSWRLVIHFCTCNFSIFISYFHNINNFILTSNISLCYISDKYSSKFILFDLKVLLCCVKQISHFLHINLNHTHFDCKLHIFWWIFNFWKYSSHHSWNNSLHLKIFDIRSLHCECLSRTCLSISKYSSIKPFKDTFKIRNWLLSIIGFPASI